MTLLNEIQNFFMKSLLCLTKHIDNYYPVHHFTSGSEFVFKIVCNGDSTVMTHKGLIEKCHSIPKSLSHCF